MRQINSLFFIKTMKRKTGFASYRTHKAKGLPFKDSPFLFFLKNFPVSVNRLHQYSRPADQVSRSEDPAVSSADQVPRSEDPASL